MGTKRRQAKGRDCRGGKTVRFEGEARGEDDETTREEEAQGPGRGSDGRGKGREHR